MVNVKSIDYGLTVTVKPKWYKMTPEQQLDLASAEFIGKMAEYKCRYTMIAEFTKAYNIHFHVIVSFNEYKKDYLRLIYDIFRDSRYIGFILAKPVENYTEWINYITKDTSEIYNKLKCRHPVIQNDYKLDFKLHRDD